MTATSRFVDNGGVRIHCLDTGDDGSGRPPIVFAPGVTDVALDYAPVLAELGRRAVVVDLRGRGLSDSPSEGYSMEHQVADFAAVVDEVTQGPVHVMTFSRGTCYAVVWASANPERVLSVAIGDYPGRVVGFPDGIVPRFMAGTWRGTPVPERVSEHAFARIVAEADERQLWDHLAALAVPFLVVRAGRGSFIEDDDWSRYRELLPQARMVVFEDSPHDLFRPDRTRYLDLVREHVEQAERIR